MTNHAEEEAKQQLTNKLLQIDPPESRAGFMAGQGNIIPHPSLLDPNMNPTVQLTRYNSDQETGDEGSIEDYFNTPGTINPDWYVPDLKNTRIRDSIKNTCLPGQASTDRLVIHCPNLREFFPVSSFELDLKTGKLYIFSQPPEDIGVACQAEMFDNDLLQSQFRARITTTTLGDGEKELERIPIIRKTSPVADMIDTAEIKKMLGQYGQLCKLYTDASCKLARKCRISPFELIKACQVYKPYIRDVSEQIDKAVALFAMENELRNIKGKGHFTAPTITPHGRSFESSTQTNTFLEELDKEIVKIVQEIIATEAENEKEKA